MRALLMYPNRDFDPPPALPWHEQSLRQDLELDTLLRAMADDDEFLFDVARKALLSGVRNDVDTILYRQEIVRDGLSNPQVVRELYALAVEAIEGKRKSYWSFSSHYPSSILHGAIEVLRMFMTVLRKLRDSADAHAGRFRSRGFTALFAMLQKEFSDEYLASVDAYLAELKFGAGVLLSAQLGPGNEGTHYMLRRPHEKKPGWLKWIMDKGPPAYTFRIADRDMAGAQVLSSMRDRGINLVANALAQSVDHILRFFEMLRMELAFHVGCLNLHDRLALLGAPACFAQPQALGTRVLRFGGLYDVCLALSMGCSVVGNALDADGKSLLIITGANQGGKSSFLRGIGLAQLMMQSGMFVSAEFFAAELRSALFTHYKREEDATMMSGKLDEELGRISAIADGMAPGSMLLLNESFASTNEREGAEIARQIVGALLERGIRIFFVTHLYAFAHSLFERRMHEAIFLRAQRLADGTRTFRISEGEPLQTSYGEDLYREIFPAETETTAR